MTTTVDATGLDTLRGDLWAAVTGRDEYRAADLVLTALDTGISAETVLLDVIAPVQARVGRAWQADRLTVAQEHAATAIAERVIAALAHHPAHRPAPYGGRITVACVDQEWHALPARLLAEVLTLRGWRVDFLGAQVPTPHLVTHLHNTGADAVALSSSLATRLPTAHSAITACQAVGVPVLAGGAAFGPDGRYARLLGADAWAPDARAAARRLADGIPSPDLAAGRPESDGLAHLTDQEYTLVVRARARLVRVVLAQLERDFPAMADYSAPQRERTAEDVAHIVEFLGVALYTDSDDLFTGFIRWTAAVLTARRVPARSLHPALDALAAELKDFPRATRMLDRARRHLDEAVAATDQSPGAPA
ncbi:B12-binding domain-containing protein [Streptomyces bacillaris]|uniref:Cobalamin-binding protein n=1 Tax=Streptomyces cavourensis TaxID=67258 RepID=A0AAD0Q9Y0_9ACTN|nr:MULTISPECIES: cobalamin-dependent protein [Streptomyces]NUW19195.1 cobalamin-binding protein [Streptomyces roseoviolaceus]AXI75041.1 cobalamin-binding protein [Streptomyces cavourensis]NUV41112.1 cobalamin-binding protein [Streptomyces sp. CAI-24]NUV79989.1 cobalamin-binding protein [Streptomyces sp. CAI-155]NUV85208.1 cobalamin-binding protein [Streptomyces sp. KAI-26]